MKQMNSNVATKLVTTVALLGLLASGCAHEQMKNDDPAMDLPALTLADPQPETGVPNDQLDLAAGSEVESAVADDTTHNGLDQALPVDSSVAANTTSAAALSDITPLPDLSAPVKKSGHKRHHRIAKNTKRGGKHVKIAGHGKKSHKNIAKKTEDKKPVAVAAIETAPTAPTAPVESLALDTMNDSTTAAMTLPADSQIGSKELTTIEPPMTLTQAPDISSTDNSSIWIYWAGGMVILLGSVVLFMKRRRSSARY